MPNLGETEQCIAADIDLSTSQATIVPLGIAPDLEETFRVTDGFVTVLHGSTAHAEFQLLPGGVVTAHLSSSGPRLVPESKVEIPGGHTAQLVFPKVRRKTRVAFRIAGVLERWLPKKPSQKSLEPTPYELADEEYRTLLSEWNEELTKLGDWMVNQETRQEFDKLARRFRRAHQAILIKYSVSSADFPEPVELQNWNDPLMPLIFVEVGENSPSTVEQVSPERPSEREEGFTKLLHDKPMKGESRVEQVCTEAPMVPLLEPADKTLMMASAAKHFFLASLVRLKEGLGFAGKEWLVGLRFFQGKPYSQPYLESIAKARDRFVSARKGKVVKLPEASWPTAGDALLGIYQQAFDCCSRFGIAECDRIAREAIRGELKYAEESTEMIQTICSCYFRGPGGQLKRGWMAGLKRLRDSESFRIATQTIDGTDLRNELLRVLNSDLNDLRSECVWEYQEANKAAYAAKVKSEIRSPSAEIEKEVSNLTAVERAMVIYIRDPNQSTREVARKVKCDPSLLYRDERFQRLLLANKGLIPKGKKSKEDRTIEAFDE